MHQRTGKTNEKYCSIVHKNVLCTVPTSRAPNDYRFGGKNEKERHVTLKFLFSK
jgi:hypothetical protein